MENLEPSLSLQAEQVFLNLPCGVWWMDRNHVYLGCNLITFRVVKLNPGQFLGESITNLAKKYDWLKPVAKEIYDIDERIMQKGVPEFQILHYMPQGPHEKPIRQLCAKKPIFNVKGEVIGLMGAGVFERDLSNNFEIKIDHFNEDQFIIQNHPTININFREAFQISPCGFFWMNRKHIYLGCNQETCRVLRLNTQREMIGKNILDIAKAKHWPPFRAENIYDLDETIMSTGIAEYSIENIMPQGEKVPAIRQIVAKKPIYSQNGNILGLMGVAIYDGRFGERSKWSNL